jgi:hypothetical protein
MTLQSRSYKHLSLLILYPAKHSVQIFVSFEHSKQFVSSHHFLQAPSIKLYPVMHLVQLVSDAQVLQIDGHGLHLLSF